MYPKFLFPSALSPQRPALLFGLSGFDFANPKPSAILKADWNPRSRSTTDRRSDPSVDANMQLSFSSRHYVLFFLVSLTRRASRTSRGYRWPTSGPISYSSKVILSQSTTPALRRPPRASLSSPSTTTKTTTTVTTTTTVQQQRQVQHRHGQSAQLHSTIYTSFRRLFLRGLPYYYYSRFLY